MWESNQRWEICILVQNDQCIDRVHFELVDIRLLISVMDVYQLEHLNTIFSSRFVRKVFVELVNADHDREPIQWKSIVVLQELRRFYIEVITWIKSFCRLILNRRLTNRYACNSNWFIKVYSKTNLLFKKQSWFYKEIFSCLN